MVETYQEVPTPPLETLKIRARRHGASVGTVFQLSAPFEFFHGTSREAAFGLGSLSFTSMNGLALVKGNV